MNMGKITQKPAKNPFPQGYNWLERHSAVMTENKKRKPDLIFIGDSITHYFGGFPVDDIVRGGETWNTYYAHRNPVNMGCGWDRVQHMLWRLDNGAIDGISPKLAVLLAGANNILWEDESSPEDVAEGIRCLIGRLMLKLACTRILLVGILPIGYEPDNARRQKSLKVNRLTETFADGERVFFINAGKNFITAEGFQKKELFIDGVHPGPKGYSVYAEVLEPLVSRLLDEAKPA
jgi:beta-glucosidase